MNVKSKCPLCEGTHIHELRGEGEWFVTCPTKDRPYKVTVGYITVSGVIV